MDKTTLDESSNLDSVKNLEKGSQKDDKSYQQKITELVRGRSYGFNVEEIFSECSKVFKWDSELKFKLSDTYSTMAYAEKCDAEGNSVLFIEHLKSLHTMGGRLGSPRLPENAIFVEYRERCLPVGPNYNYRITENFDYCPRFSQITDCSNRIIFARYNSEGYIFCGVFKVIVNDFRERVYERISHTYPIKTKEKK